MPPLTDLSLVDDLHVVVAFGAPTAPEEVFLLDLHLDEPRAALADSAYLASLSPVVALLDSTDGCVVRVGREHRLGTPTTSALEISVSLPMPARQADETDPSAGREQSREMQKAVAAAFRDLIAAAPTEPTGELGHDEALATARRRVAEVTPGADAARLSVVAEEHGDGRWSVRLVDPSAVGHEVYLGFVDGHPGTTHVKRVMTGEVVDSVGAD